MQSRSLTLPDSDRSSGDNKSERGASQRQPASLREACVCTRWIAIDHATHIRGLTPAA